MAISLVALQPLEYNHRQIPKGAVFEAASEHATVLKALGRAKDYDPDQKPSKPHLRIEEPVTERAQLPPDEDGPYGPPDDEAVASSEEPQPRKKRTYKRRDLTAESE